MDNAGAAELLMPTFNKQNYGRNLDVGIHMDQS